MTSQQERTYVEKIQANYSTKTQQKTKFQELKELNKKVCMPAIMFSYIYGILGTLILGTGMCFAMSVFGDAISVTTSMIVGVVVGIVGIVIVSTTYPIFKSILNKRKSKYSHEILAKSNELLNNY